MVALRIAAAPKKPTEGVSTWNNGCGGRLLIAECTSMLGLKRSMRSSVINSYMGMMKRTAEMVLVRGRLLVPGRVEPVPLIVTSLHPPHHFASLTNRSWARFLLTQ